MTTLDPQAARDKVLGAVRKATADAGPALPPDPTPPPLPAHEPTDYEAQVAQFAAELTALKGEFVRTTRAEAPAQILALIEELEARQYIGWPLADLPVPGLADMLDSHIDHVPVTLPPTAAERKAAVAKLAPVKLGITGVVAAIAQVGAVVVRSGPQSPRLALLMPPVHLAIVTKAQFHATLGAYFDTLAAQDKLNQSAIDSALTLVIAGPSRSGDIERILTLGVHGPGRVIVMLVE